nr:PREDICTED: squalene monooxygenase-like isoform X2 [Latimeria chalumnae]|eukprot:XP_005998750.1 PREDICTED: squalene monooxygenase-like isoform X2 [Latimeria chalumnae]
MDSLVQLRKNESGSTQEVGPEVIIVGAGVLGAAMAALLARDGRKVVLIERDMTPPDRFAGEYLQPGGVRTLKELGLKDALEGIEAQKLYGFVITEVASNTDLNLDFPTHENEREQDGGRAFHNGRFVMGLRRAAAAEPNVKIIEGTMMNLLEDGGRIVGVEYKDKASGDMKEVFAPLTVVADGQYSNFRTSLVPNKYHSISNYIGILVKGCPEFKKDKAELILVNQTLIIVYQISVSETRMLIDIQGPMPKNLKEYLTKNIYPYLPERIKAVFLETIQTQRMRGTPVGVVKASILKKPGVLLLGDSYNVRNPVVASGMSIALIDLKLWRDLLWAIPDLKDDKAMLQAKKKFHWSRKSSHSIVINVLAQFFYVIFTATGGYIFHLRQGYLDYLKSGKCGLEMAGMISVLATNPKLLAVHFRAAALHAVCLFFKTEPWYLKPRAAFHSCAFLFRNFAVFFPVLYSELW